MPIPEPVRAVIEAFARDLGKPIDGYDNPHDALYDLGYADGQRDARADAIDIPVVNGEFSVRLPLDALRPADAQPGPDAERPVLGTPEHPVYIRLAFDDVDDDSLPLGHYRFADGTHLSRTHPGLTAPDAGRPMGHADADDGWTAYVGECDDDPVLQCGAPDHLERPHLHSADEGNRVIFRVAARCTGDAECRVYGHAHARADGGE